jgi:hypothetical protein
MQAKRTPGIRLRHAKKCAIVAGSKCDCDPAVEAWIWDRRTKRKITKRFTGRAAKSAAKQWR